MQTEDGQDSGHLPVLLHQAIDALLLIQLRGRIVPGGGHRQVLDGILIILAPPQRFAVGVQHFEPEHLKRQGNQFGQLSDTAIFLMEQDQDLLREILGQVLLDT